MAVAPRGRLPPQRDGPRRYAFAANRATFRAAVRDIAAQFKEFARTAPGGGDGLLHVRPARDRGRRGGRARRGK
jgi:hypothetical protein